MYWYTSCQSQSNRQRWKLILLPCLPLYECCFNPLFLCIYIEVPIIDLSTSPFPLDNNMNTYNAIVNLRNSKHDNANSTKMGNEVNISSWRDRSILLLRRKYIVLGKILCVVCNTTMHLWYDWHLINTYFLLFLIVDFNWLVCILLSFFTCHISICPWGNARCVYCFLYYTLNTIGIL